MSQYIDPATLALEEIRQKSLEKTAQDGTQPQVAPIEPTQSASPTVEVPTNQTPTSSGWFGAGKGDAMAEAEQNDSDRKSAWDNIKGNKDLPMLGLMFGLNMLANSGTNDLGTALGKAGATTLNAYQTMQKQKADADYKRAHMDLWQQQAAAQKKKAERDAQFEDLKAEAWKRYYNGDRSMDVMATLFPQQYGQYVLNSQLAEDKAALRPVAGSSSRSSSGGGRAGGGAPVFVPATSNAPSAPVAASPDGKQHVVVGKQGEPQPGPATDGKLPQGAPQQGQPAQPQTGYPVGKIIDINGRELKTDKTVKWGKSEYVNIGGKTFYGSWDPTRNAFRIEEPPTSSKPTGGKSASFSDASKMAGLMGAKKDLDTAVGGFFDQYGDLNRLTVAKSGIPTTDAHRYELGMRRAVENWLRAMTGATAKKEEVDEYMKTFSPHWYQTSETARDSVRALYTRLIETAKRKGYDMSAIENSLPMQTWERNVRERDARVEAAEDSDMNNYFIDN